MNTKKIIIKIMCFVLIGLLLLYVAGKVLMPKWTTSKDNRMTYIIK